MLLKYIGFTVISAVLSLWCTYNIENPYQVIHIFYNTFCIYLSERVHKCLSNINLLTCVAAEGYNDASSLSENEILFTKETLSQFTGDEENLYLSILGEVFDVSKGKKHYGKGSGYHGFTGKDGSRAFITGDFTEEGFIEDVLDLSPQELKSLSFWTKFYHKEYSYKGKLIGKYYDANGRPTKYYYELQKKLVEAEKTERVSEKFKAEYPPCNVEFDAKTGTRVWCSQRSGGIQRDWVGVPRNIYEPGSKNSRCACLNLMGQSDAKDKELKVLKIEDFKGCHPQASSCYVTL